MIKKNVSMIFYVCYIFQDTLFTNKNNLYGFFWPSFLFLPVQTAQDPWRSFSELGHHVPMSLLAYTNNRLCSSNRCLTSPAQWNSVPMPTEQRDQTRKINSSSWVIILSCETGKSTPSEIIKIKSEIISSKKRTWEYFQNSNATIESTSQSVWLLE